MLRVRVQALESDKRDTVEVLNRKSNDYDSLQEDYQKAQEKNIAYRREISELETRVQQAESTQSTLKFKAQSLGQEVEMLKRRNEDLHNELTVKSAEYQKFRKEKNSHVSTLQGELDEAIQNHNLALKSLEDLRGRFEEATRKSEERLQKINQLQDSAGQQEESFRQEINAQKRLAELYERQVKTSKARIAELEKIMDQEHQRHSDELGKLKATLETTEKELARVEQDCQEKEVEIERIQGDLVAFQSGVVVPDESPSRASSRHASPSGNGFTTPQRRGSSAAATPFRTPNTIQFKKQMAGISVTQLYSDFAKTKAAYEVEKRRNAKLEESINELIADMETNEPVIDEIKAENARYQQELVESSQLLEEAYKVRDRLTKENRKAESALDELKRERNLLGQEVRDLSLQLRVLLVENERRDAGLEDMSEQQNELYQQIIRGEVDNGETNDTDAIISQRLIAFRTVKELQEQNHELTKALRDLAQRVEDNQAANASRAEEEQTEEVKKLMDIIERMKDDLRNQVQTSEAYMRERDMFRRMLQSKRNGGTGEEGDVNTVEAQQAIQEANQMREALREMQVEHDQYRQECLQNIATLNEQIRKITAEKNTVELEMSKVKTQWEMQKGMDILLRLVGWS